MNTSKPRTEGLLAWQWSNYRTAHTDRQNLLMHALSAPVFILGGLALPAALATGAWWLAPAGLAGMLAAVAVQGRTHRREYAAPAPFSGPLDVAARLFAEQWVTFPRYVLSGEFGRAWRSAAA
jgi:hypothetical protein